MHSSIFLRINWIFLYSCLSEFGLASHNLINIPELFIYENLSIGSIVHQDIRTFLNLPPQSLVKIGPGSLGHFFKLESETGELMILKNLDLESPHLCNVEKSCCREEKHLTTMDSVTLNTMSMFTNGPSCRLMSYVLVKSSKDQQLTPVTKLHITILDVNDNAPIFNVDNNVLQKSITRITSTYQPELHVAFVEGKDGLISKQDLSAAYDADFSPKNRVQKYWLEWPRKNYANSSFLNFVSVTNSDTLHVDESSGSRSVVLDPFRLVDLNLGNMLALELQSVLDREQQSSYEILLVAEDGGGLRGTLRIIVDVIDVNEFDPVFTDEPTNDAVHNKKNLDGVYTKQFKVDESLSIGSEIGKLYAYDKDASSGNQIVYRFGHGSSFADAANHFQLDPFTGSISLKKKLDYEKTRKYRLPVIAQDESGHIDISDNRKDRISQIGSIRRSTTGFVEITVNDVNDNVPLVRFETNLNFSKSLKDSQANTQEVWIKEDVPIGYAVTYFTVSDYDSGENGKVTCNLGNWTDTFRLREASGLFTLETLVTFDRESLDEYCVVLECVDHGTYPLKCDQHLQVHIEDVNDQPPVFPVELYHFTVMENSPPNTHLYALNSNYPTKIRATDVDLNNTIRYYLAPIEEDRIPTEFTKYLKTNSVVNDHHLFKIDPETGLLTTQGELDREMRSMHAFKVCADDGIHSSCSSVLVTLQDMNDNKPTFERDTYVVRVEENLLISKPLIVFNVKDADKENAGFKFEIMSDDDPEYSQPDSQSPNPNFPYVSTPGSVRYHFALRENILYLRRPLDREMRPSYHFYIKVTDSHTFPEIFATSLSTQLKKPNLTSRAEVFIDVTDVNDNVPWLVFPNSTGQFGNRLSVSCHENMGSSVGRLQASDADLGQNASLMFSLIHTPELSQYFYLDGHSGELFVNTGQLSQKCGQNVLLLVTVDDQGPTNSKRSRNLPVEKLVIVLEDKPTLGKLLEFESRQRLQQESMTEAAHKNATYLYGHISTRSILSAVLGGSTIFLMCLLIGWIILLIVNRSRRMKPLTRQGPTSSASNHFSLEASNILGTREKTENGIQYEVNNYLDDLSYNSAHQDTTGNTIEIHQAAMPLNTMRRFYGSPSHMVCKHKSLIERGHRTDMAAFRYPEKTSEFDAVCWRLKDEGVYEKMRPDEGMTYKSATWSRTNVPKNNGEKYLDKNLHSSSTLGRLLPKWIKNNIGTQEKKRTNANNITQVVPKQTRIPVCHAIHLSQSPVSSNFKEEIHPSLSQVAGLNTTEELPYTRLKVVSSDTVTENSGFSMPSTSGSETKTVYINSEQLHPKTESHSQAYSKSITTNCTNMPDQFFQGVIANCPIRSSESASRTSEYAHLLRDASIPPNMYSGEMLYPCCCCTCDIPHRVWTDCDHFSFDVSTIDSAQTCLQCHQLEAPSQQACCINNVGEFSVMNSRHADQLSPDCTKEENIDKLCSAFNSTV